MELPLEILEALERVSSYFVDETDWMTFKKEVLKNLRPETRRLFSTRDPKTKGQSLNDFELKLIEHWFQRTGVTLVLAP